MLSLKSLPGFSSSQSSLCSFRLVLITISILLMSGCATEKLGENIGGQRTAPVSLPEGPVALVMSASANATVKELEKYNQHYSSGFTARLYTESIRQAYIETSDPSLSLAAVTRMLEARFGRVQRFNSFEEASRNGFKLIVSLDMQVRLINNRSSEPASYLSLEFHAADRQYLGTVKSSSSRTLSPVWAGAKREKEIVSDIRQQGEVQAQTIELLRQKLVAVPVNI